MSHDNESASPTLPNTSWALLCQSPAVLWWDVDPTTINPRTHAAWIIARVLEFGTWEDHVVLFQLYSHDTIEAALSARRVPESIRAFWQRYFGERNTHHMHCDTLHPSTAALWRRLGPKLCLPEYLLVGGTAVALYLGHRESNDLDFMTSTAQSSDSIISQIQAVYPSVQIIHTSAYSVHAVLEDVRVSYLWQPGVQFDPGATVDGIPLASLDTLAALKCNAIANRGARKDFIVCTRSCNQAGH